MCLRGSKFGNHIISKAVRNKLFKRPGEKFGQDLAARNIQRGRDHELGSYNSYRQACGLPALPKSFWSVPPKEIKQELWNKFKRAYKKPDDIELFPGGLAETALSGALVGPTFGCIIGEQFRRLKFGDRYFFTHANVNRTLRFCKADLAQIRSRTLKDVICDNTEMKTVPKNTLLHDIT